MHSIKVALACPILVLGFLLGPILKADPPSSPVTFSGLTFPIEDLTFTLKPGATNEFFAEGSSRISVDGQTLDLTIPSNGMEIAESDGSFTLVSLNAQITGDFDFFGLSLSVPENNPVSFSYDSSLSLYRLRGEVMFNLAGETITASFGNAILSQPGLLVSDGRVLDFGFVISDDLKVAGLQLSRDFDIGLDYRNKDGVETYAMAGGFTVEFDEKQSLSIQAGTFDSPGIVYSIDSDKALTIDDFSVSVTGDLSLFGISLSENGLTFEYQTGGGNTSFILYGSATLDVESDSFTADLGSSNEPGLTIVNGTVTEADFGLATTVSVGDFKFTSPDNDPLTLSYQSSGRVFELSGEAELDKLWDTKIELGTSTQPGIKIANNRWVIDDFTIEISKLSLGFAELNELKVSFSRGMGGEVSVDVDLSVTIPEVGIEVDADVDVDNGKIASIYLDFQASGTSEGLEILDTGVDIVNLGAKIGNLDNPKNLYIEGMIGLEFGGQIEIDGTTVTLAYIGGKLYIDPDELSLSDTIFLGAFEESSGDWKSLIFEGDAKLDFDWSKNVYTLSGGIRMPTDYGIRIDETLRFADEEVTLMASAEVRVPDAIKIIGGLDLGSINADMLLDLEDSNRSFAAGWVDVKFLFIKGEAGLKYQFSDGSFSFIGSSQISNIQNETKSAADREEFIERKYTFDVPDGAKALIFDIDWDFDISKAPPPFEFPIIDFEGEAYVLNQANLRDKLAISFYQLSFDGDDKSLKTGFSDDVISFEGKDGIRLSSEGFVVYDPLSDRVIEHLPLAAGQAEVTVKYRKQLDDALTFHEPTIAFDYGSKSATISASVSGSAETLFQTASSEIYDTGEEVLIEISAFSDPLYEDSTTISVYLDTDASGRNGHAILTDVPYDNPLDADSVKQTVKWKAQNPSGDINQEYYLYVRLDNQNQSIRYSDYIGPFQIRPAVYGTVSDTLTGNGIGGLRVYLDADRNGEYDAGSDPTRITRDDGSYGFRSVNASTQQVGVIAPPGLEYPADSSGLAMINQNSPTDLSVIKLPSASGLIYVDSNGNGSQDPDENGLAGVVVYIDEDNSGSFDQYIDTFAVTNSHGVWEFNDVPMGQSIEFSVLAFPGQLPDSNSHFVITTNATDRLFSTAPIAVSPDAVDELSDPSYMEFALTHFTNTDLFAKSGDPDRDGIINKLEQILMTDPLVANREAVMFRVQGLNQEILEMLTAVVDSRRYSVQVSTDLDTWTTVDRFRAPQTAAMMLELDMTGVPGPAFVRVEVAEF